MTSGSEKIMTDITLILNAIEQGDTLAMEKLLPLVYLEICLLTTQKMKQEIPGQILQVTALLYNAYIRLVENNTNSDY